MNKARKIFTLFSLFVLLSFSLFPVTALSEQQESSEPVNNESSTQLINNPLENISSTEVSSGLTETTETTSSQDIEIEMSGQHTETTSSSSDEAGPASVDRQARANVTPIMEITDWQLLKNGVALSESVHAVTGEAYELKFNWEVKNSTLAPGDYVTFRMPYNRGPAGDDVGASGSWRTSGSSQAVPLTTVIDGQPVKFAEWFIEAYDGGVDYEQIRIQFTDGVRLLEGKNIGTEISTGFDSIKNYTYKGGIQQVEFGGKQKPIDFSQDKLEKSTGWNYKNAMGASVNQIQYDIPVNLPASVELGGDVFDYDVNDDGWAFNPTNPAYDWGEHVTDMEKIYVEDTLDEGVTINGLLIIASALAPMQLPANALTDYRGGMVSTLSSFNSYVLADFGNGPTYRTANDPISERQLPKQEYSFKRLYQETNESKEDFRNRVKEHPYQYGIFLDEATNKQSLMVYFGDIKKGGSGTKYSDLTDQKYTSSGKEIEGSKTDKVFSFAEQAASQLIKNGHYTEADRDELEAYFTLVYGDNNALGGQVATFEISFNAQYPPDTKSEEKTNTAHHYFTGPKAPDFPILDEVTGKHKLTNPYSNVQLSSSEALLFKFTDKNLPLNGAKFELEKKNGEDWETVANSEVTTSTVKVNVLEGEQIVERQLDGGAKVSDLPNGTYRFVEIESPEGYDPVLSPNYDAEAKKVVSSEFTIPSAGQSSVVFVTNVAQPKYTVQHYVQTGANATAESDFELRLQESFNGKSGTKVEAVGKSFAGYRLDEGIAYTKKNGTVLEDGSLVLKLYYVKDETSRPFYFYKYDESNNPMPSVDFKGDPLGEGKEVTFDIYEYNNAGWDSKYEKKYEPDKVVPTSGTELPEGGGKVWKKVDTLTTDSNWKISSSDLSLTEENDGGLITYAVVETKTYDGYKLPENDQYWVIWTRDKIGEDAAAVPVTPYINGITSVNDAPYSDAINSSVPQNEKEYFISNKYDNWSLYKEDVAGNSMPSVNKNGDPLGDDKKVEFDWYEYVGNWEDEQDPKKVAPGESSVWKKRGTMTTDVNGKLVGDAIPREKKTFGLVETSTYKGYRVPSSQQAYWVLWDNGYIENCGSDNPGTKFKEPYFYTLKNDYATEIQIYKTDAETQIPLRKNDKAQVGFRYYRYIGGWDGEGPDKNTDLSNIKNWLPIENQQNDTNIFYADDEGKLTGLEENFVGSYPHGNTYAIQEVEAYPGYQLDKGYWYLFLNEKRNPKTYTIEDIHHVGEGYPIVAPSDENNKLNAHQLTNQQLPYPDLEFTKINDNHAVLANVDFKLYKAKGEIEFNEETEKDGSYWDLNTPYREETSSLAGKVSFAKLPKGIYLLRETKTVAGYQLPDGDWVIEVDPAAEPKITIRARKDTSSPAFKVENKEYYLPNYQIHSLPFTGKWGKVLLLVIGILLIGLAGLVKVKKPVKSKV